MNLQDKREALETKQTELASVKEKSLENATKLKAVTVEDDTYIALKEEADGLLAQAETLKTEIDALDAEITSDEQALEEAAKKLNETNHIKEKTMTEYLKTKQAGLDYAKLLADNQGVSSKSLANMWEENLKAKGVTNLDAVLPEPVLLAIENAFEDYQGVLNHVSKDPRYAAKITLQTVKNFAKGHLSGKTKKDTDINFVSIAINSATVYIKHAFEYADLKKDVNGVYFNHVMQELAQGFIRAVERAIVIGDGLAPEDEDKITEIKSIAEETEANLFATQAIDTSVAEFTNTQFEALVAGLDQIMASGTPIIVTSKAVARKMKLAKDSEGRYMDLQPFAPISSNGGQIAGYTVYVYDWMNEATNPIIAFADKAYTLIGDDVSADRFEDYDVTINRRHIELASVMGGRLSAFKGAVKFTEQA